MEIQRALSLAQVALWIALAILLAGRKYEGPLVPGWLRNASTSRAIWIAICAAGVLLSVCRLFLP